MQEGEASPAMRQLCNMCWNEANGACFRTRCGHLFCESCAYQHFGQSQACAACGASLEEADVWDVTLGLDATSQIEKIVFQEAFKEPDYSSVRKNLHRTAMALSDTASFTISQIVLDNQRRAENSTQLNSEIVKLRHDMGRVSMQLRNQAAESEQKLGEVVHKLRLRERELIDLQEAYKEKSRKCSAWEKAYGNLRSQMDRGGRGGGGHSAGFTPPESPRAGAMRAGASGSFTGVSGGQNIERGGPVQLQQQVSPRGSGRGTMPRPPERSSTISPYSSSRPGTYMGRSGGDGGGGGGGGSSRSSWPMPMPMSRPTTSRGGGGGGGNCASPMLRPRQGQGFPSHSVTPSPTFSAQQQGATSRFPAKRPETPAELRGYYSRNPSPSSRSGGGGGGGGGGGEGGGGRSGGFFTAPKPGLF
eukprot:g17675.t1